MEDKKNEKLFENLPILNQGINAPKKPLEINTSLNLSKTSNVKKKILLVDQLIKQEKLSFLIDQKELIT